MKSKTYRFKKGKGYALDNTCYILSPFLNSFRNIDSEGNSDVFSDDTICLRDCSITIRWKDEKRNTRKNEND